MAMAINGPAVESKDLRRWLQLQDKVLWHQAASAMGSHNLKVLAEEYISQGSMFEAAKVSSLLALTDMGSRNPRCSGWGQHCL